jgi:hypothetical protein
MSTESAREKTRVRTMKSFVSVLKGRLPKGCKDVKSCHPEEVVRPASTREVERGARSDHAEASLMSG